MLKKERLFFLGASSIAEAMVRGFIGADLLLAQQITMSTRKNIQRFQRLKEAEGKAEE
jgi:pyrroline-5-carboxylate reductase